jgi:hypothetical protein
MELLLNIAWAFLAIVMVGLWLRFSPRDTPNRGIQLVALAVLLFILLPAISMTDDLLAAQNPAEIDCCLRRDHESSAHPCDFLMVAALPLLLFSGLAAGIQYSTVPGIVAPLSSDPPALASIQNRPPPSA